MQIKFINSILDIDASAWDELWPSRYPFCRHAFLKALECSGSTNGESGWQAMHCVGFNGDALVFAMPLFLKTHSYGEYVFDWAWADAYHRNGLEYYPKLVNAVPFTPATGPRWASAERLSSDTIQKINTAIFKQAEFIDVSSFHCLFPDAGASALYQAEQFIQRQGCQYHWFNNNYRNFDDFLAELSSRKRKNIKKERAKCQNFDIHFYEGREASREDWKLFYALYHRTYLKRSGRPGYLTEQFFTDLAQSLDDQIILAIAEKEGEKIAGAVYFKDDDCLYGRYWGTLNDIDALHFETCYYQGIEYAISKGLKRFDPGAQGEHKIKRGFQPIRTCSFHWLVDERFHAAVDEFCTAEAHENTAYIEHARTFLPFKEGYELNNINALLNEAE